MSSINMRIKQLRKEYALTQVKFAERLGITNAHVSAIEKGKTTPSTALVKLISTQFEVNERWLINGTEPMFIYELEDELEQMITSDIDRMNKIRTRDNIPIRSWVINIENLFTDMLEFKGLDDKQHEKYLGICYKLFYHLNAYLIFQKKSSEQKQFHLFPFPDDLMSSLKSDIEKFEEFFDSLIKNE